MSYISGKHVKSTFQQAKDHVIWTYIATVKAVYVRVGQKLVGKDTIIFEKSYLFEYWELESVPYVFGIKKSWSII